MRVKWDDIFDNPDLLKEFVVPTYKIPKNILDRIPDYFWAGFAGGLCAIFGPGIFEKDLDGFYKIEYITSTGGWAVALMASCEQMSMDWIMSYYTSLSWDESDLFDDELADSLIQKFVENKDGKECRDAHYKWLVERRRKT